MKQLLIALLLIMVGTGCTAASSSSVQQPAIDVEHLIIDSYSYNPDSTEPVAQETSELWYTPGVGGRAINSLDQPTDDTIVTSYVYSDVINEADYFVASENVRRIVEQDSGNEPPAQITKLPKNWHGANNPRFVEMLLEPIWETKSDWLDNTQTESYTVLVTTEIVVNGFQLNERFTLDHTTGQITQRELINSETNQVFEKMVVRTRETEHYDPTFMTLAGWKATLPEPDLPIVEDDLN